MSEKIKLENKVEIRNRKASHEYHFMDSFIAGLVLKGTEIKSIRQQKVNMQDAWCLIENDKVIVKNMHISAYEKGSWLNHNPMRDRILLLRKNEIKKIDKKLLDQGTTLIPIRLFISERGFAKMEIVLAKGKKLFDKREDLREKDLKREANKTSLDW